MNDIGALGECKGISGFEGAAERHRPGLDGELGWGFADDGAGAASHEDMRGTGTIEKGTA